jgi:ABC-type multidrug transport system fused ATPase/permease subunit
MMPKSITYIAPHKTALTVSLVFALCSLLFVVPMAIFFSLMPATDQMGNPVNTSSFLYMMLIMPILYFVFGYIFTGIAAWIYNHVSKFTGGIKYEAVE